MATEQGTTVASKTLENDDEVGFDDRGGGGVPSFAFNGMGTGPAVTSLRGGGNHFRVKITSGTGTPTIQANSIQITLSRPVRKAFLAITGVNTPNWGVVGFGSGSQVVIGCKVAPVASTAYDFELIVLF